MGKLELVHLLLAAGADPALANESGETPLSVGASDEIKDAIRSFDPVETGRLVEEFATRAAARKAEARAAATAEESKLEDALVQLSAAIEKSDRVEREAAAARSECKVSRLVVYFWKEWGGRNLTLSFIFSLSLSLSINQ